MSTKKQPAVSEPDVLICLRDIIAKIETGDQVTKPARKSKQPACTGTKKVRQTTKQCKCGSTTHLRTSHSDCALKKFNG
eukprot:COSAG05_NODE_1078_length_5954_cov_7.170794_7_plen_79_part_00